MMLLGKKTSRARFSSAMLPRAAKRWHPCRLAVRQSPTARGTHHPVFWFYATLTLLGIASITVSRRDPVRIAGCVLLAGLLGWGLLQRLLRPPNEMPERGKSVSPATEVVTVDSQAVGISDLVLSGGGAPFELRGRITNNSTGTRLSSVTLSLQRLDCHAAALDPRGCDILFQDQHWIPLSVPAGESREFLATIWVHSTPPRARGTIKDEFSVVAASGGR
jgi:hypothetical protein